LPIGDLRTDAKENLITAIQIVSLIICRLLARSAFILNTNCIEVELLKLMRNTLKLYITKLSTFVESGAFKKWPELFLAQKKAQATGTKSLIAMW
jgi:hypothetical protein